MLAARVCVVTYPKIHPISLLSFFAPPALLAVFELSLKLFGIHKLPTGLHEVLLQHVVPTCADREEACFCAHIPQVSTVEAVCELDNALEVDVTSLGDRRRVDLEHVQTA